MYDLFDKPLVKGYNNHNNHICKVIESQFEFLLYSLLVLSTENLNLFNGKVNLTWNISSPHRKLYELPHPFPEIWPQKLQRKE